MKKTQVFHVIQDNKAYNYRPDRSRNGVTVGYVGSLQDALDLARTNAIINLEAGTWDLGHLVIPEGKDGLLITGQEGSHFIVDAPIEARSSVTFKFLRIRARGMTWDQDLWDDSVLHPDTSIICCSRMRQDPHP